MQHKGGVGAEGALPGGLEGAGATGAGQYTSMSVLQSAQLQRLCLVLWPRKTPLQARDQQMQTFESFCKSRVMIGQVCSGALMRQAVARLE